MDRAEAKDSYHESLGHAITAFVASISCEQDGSRSVMLPSIDWGAMAIEWVRAQKLNRVVMAFMIGMKLGWLHDDRRVEEGRREVQQVVT